jgi:hypothetical protein
MCWLSSSTILKHDLHINFLMLQKIRPPPSRLPAARQDEQCLALGSGVKQPHARRLEVDARMGDLGAGWTRKPLDRVRSAGPAR